MENNIEKIKYFLSYDCNQGRMTMTESDMKQTLLSVRGDLLKNMRSCSNDTGNLKLSTVASASWDTNGYILSMINKLN